MYSYFKRNMKILNCIQYPCKVIAGFLVVYIIVKTYIAKKK